MNIKNLSSLAVISLGLCFTGFNVNAVHSSELKENNSDAILLAQLRGHDTYDGQAQIQWQDYSLGRVVGKSGAIMSILVEDGAVFNAEGSVMPGCDVLVGKDSNGKYYFVDASSSTWISRLEADYGYKRNAIALASLNERTAAIWAEIEASSNTTTQIPEHQVIERQTTEYTPINEPVRGLW